MFETLNRKNTRLAERLVARLTARGLTLATAESLTGGLIGAMLTAVPGSSAAYWGGFVTYAVDAKVRLLGVDPETVRLHGVVSRETALAMAMGALRGTPADIAIAVTGLAGPGGGTLEVPVGTVWIAMATRIAASDGNPVALCLHAPGGRSRVRRQTVYTALDMVDCLLDRL